MVMAFRILPWWCPTSEVSVHSESGWCRSIMSRASGLLRLHEHGVSVSAAAKESMNERHALLLAIHKDFAHREHPITTIFLSAVLTWPQQIDSQCGDFFVRGGDCGDCGGQAMLVGHGGTVVLGCSASAEL